MIYSYKNYDALVKEKDRGGVLKKIAVIITLIFILIGCSNEEEKVINKLKSTVEGKYGIVIFDDEMTSDEFQQSINHKLFDTNKLWGDEVYSINYIILDENTSQDYNYEEVLSLNIFPEIFVFDDKEVVFRTNKLDELEKFFLN